MSATVSTVLLQRHLKALKLPTLLAACEKVAARRAAENVDASASSSASANWNCSNANAGPPSAACRPRGARR